MMCVNELSDDLTEVEITAAISQMRKGRALAWKEYLE